MMSQGLSNMDPKPMNGSRVLVLGAGPAGTAAALELSCAGLEVHVVEKASKPGGQAVEYSCKATDQCLRCNVCLAQEHVRQAYDAEKSPNITLHTNAELKELKQTPTQAGPVYTAVIDQLGQAEPLTLEVAHVMVCTGFDPYDPSDNNALGYGKIPNVISGLDMEKLSPADHLQPVLRPSDQTPPKNIAFIQCVGSRNEKPHRCPERTNYCSAVCCSYALRLARLIRHISAKTDSQAEPTEITVFNMDIQRFGRDFESFYAQCKEQMRFIKARPYQLAAADGDRVTVRYEDQPTCQQREETFDMVVLSVGIRPNPDNAKVSAKLDLPVNEQGFFDTAGCLAGATARGGIYVAGTARAPTDIAHAIAEAQAVAGTIIASQPE